MAQVKRNPTRLWLPIVVGKVFCVFTALMCAQYYHVATFPLVVLFTLGVLYTLFETLMRREKKKEKVKQMLDTQVDWLDVRVEKHQYFISVIDAHMMLADICVKTMRIIND